MSATAVVTTVDVVLGLGLAALTGFRAWRDHPVGRYDLGLAVLTELGTLAYVGVRIAELAGGHHPSSTGLAIAYLIGIALVLPVAAALALAERTRWGSVVLGVGGLVVCVLFARIAQVWRPHG